MMMTTLAVPRFVLVVLLTMCPLLAAAPAGAEPDAQADPPIDFTLGPLTLAFLGDSITHVGEYHQWVQLFLLTRYPGQDLWTFNAGYAGENTRGVLAKDYYALDVFPQEPDVILIHLGMNDFDLLSYNDVMEEPSNESRRGKRDDYRRRMTELVEQGREYGAQVGILSPTIYDDTHRNNKHHSGRPHANAELGRFARIAEEVAASFDDVFFIDLWTPMDAMTRERQVDDPKFTIVRDRVHPSQGGNEVMAYEVLKGLHVRPTVYDVQLDASGNIDRAEGAEVEKVQAAEGGLRFETTEMALPFPTRHVADGFGLVPIDDELNVMRLQVAGLTPGNYALRIDDTAVGEYTHEALGAGIDLSSNPETPQYREAVKLVEQVKEEKLPLQRAVADMRSLRYQLLFKKEPENEGLEWEWDRVEPEKVLDAANRLYDRLVAENKKPGGWAGQIFRTGREAWGRYGDIQQELSTLREAWAERPQSTRHVYTLTRVGGP